MHAEGSGPNLDSVTLSGPLIPSPPTERVHHGSRPSSPVTCLNLTCRQNGMCQTSGTSAVFVTSSVRAKRTSGTSALLVSSSARPKRKRDVDFRELAGMSERRARGAGAVAAEQALALLRSGQVSSQKAAAAEVGISDVQLSRFKTKHWRPYSTFNRRAGVASLLRGSGGRTG